MSRTRQFRELLRRGALTIAPGAYDCITARSITQAGFDAVAALKLVVGLGAGAQRNVNRIGIARERFHTQRARPEEAIAFLTACVALVTLVLTGAASSQELLVHMDRPNAAAKMRLGKAQMSPAIQSGLAKNVAGYLETILNPLPAQFSIGGGWEVPSIFNPYPNIPNDQELDIWVGVGGQAESDNTLIQIGTSAEIDASGKKIPQQLVHRRTT
jgi:hypothetical protein